MRRTNSHPRRARSTRRTRPFAEDAEDLSHLQIPIPGINVCGASHAEDFSRVQIPVTESTSAEGAEHAADKTIRGGRGGSFSPPNSYSRHKRPQSAARGGLFDFQIPGVRGRGGGFSSSGFPASACSADVSSAPFAFSACSACSADVSSAPSAFSACCADVSFLRILRVLRGRCLFSVFSACSADVSSAPSACSASSADVRSSACSASSAEVALPPRSPRSPRTFSADVLRGCPFLRVLRGGKMRLHEAPLSRYRGVGNGSGLGRSSENRPHRRMGV